MKQKFWCLKLKKHNFKIFSTKTKVMVFKGSEPIRAKLLDTTELIKEFKHTGCSVTYLNNNKLHRFQYTGWFA
jgi:hypothetical protein